MMNDERVVTFATLPIDLLFIGIEDPKVIFSRASGEGSCEIGKVDELEFGGPPAILFGVGFLFDTVLNNGDDPFTLVVLNADVIVILHHDAIISDRENLYGSERREGACQKFVLYSLTGLFNWLCERRPRVDEEIHNEFGEN